jgi:ABC-type transport system substrate-binding protein
MYFYSQYLGLLTALDENDKVYLKLTESLKPLSDTVWEVKLRPGLKFSNGEPLTTKDVAASYHNHDERRTSCLHGHTHGARHAPGSPQRC